MNPRKSRWIIGCLVLTISAGMAVWSCSTYYREEYARALSSWNDMMDSYRIHYEAQDPQTQRVWNQNINPLLLESSMALDAWGMSQDDKTKADAFIAMERQAVRLLLDYGVPTTTKSKK